MDFNTLITVAQKNDKKQVTATKPCYTTKFSAPKKEGRQTRELSENIKKFLAKKEEEEKRKSLEEKKKKENLLALRDHKAQSRINKHLKVCKAANKSVLADAIDNENTAVTIAGPSQCDEDDYGYVSQEASAFYNKLMNKYSSLPPEKPLFSNDGKRTVKDIASTKDRVRQALKQQELEESLPHKRKRKHRDETEDKSSKDYADTDDNNKNRDSEREKEPEKEEKPRPKKMCPPPLAFEDLLKIAEKKQHEPIKIEPKPKPKKEEPERLMTKKQMKEYAKEKEWRERKEQRIRNPESIKPASSSNDSSKPKLPAVTKCSKPNGVKTTSNTIQEKSISKALPVIAKKYPNDKPTEKNNSVQKLPERSNGIPQERSNGIYKSSEKSNPVSNRPTEKYSTSNKLSEKGSSSSRSLEKSNGMQRGNSSKVDLKASEMDVIARERRKLEEDMRKLEEMRRTIEEEKKKMMSLKNKKIEESKAQKPISKSKEPIRPSSSAVKPRQFPPTDVKSRKFPPADVKPRQFPPADVRPRQFPPPDVRGIKPKPSKLKVKKRRLCDSDDEDYDSELDDFIDDGPQDTTDVSKYISEIFGYDKSKYRDLDDDDDAAMESNFAQQLKEELISSRIGIMEDLEDIMKEKEEERQKKERLNAKRKMRKV